MVINGRMGKAIEHTMKSYPTVLESNLNLLFTLKCRQFVEMVNGSDFDVSIWIGLFSFEKSRANLFRINYEFQTMTTSNNDNLSNTPNAMHLSNSKAASQTSVIQSTKAYTNGSNANVSQNVDKNTTTTIQHNTTAQTQTLVTGPDGFVDDFDNVDNCLNNGGTQCR